MRISELMVYRGLIKSPIIKNIDLIMDSKGNDEEKKFALYDSVNQMLEIADNNGFNGNLWQLYLTYLLVNEENSYSKSCEVVGTINGSVDKLALYDFDIIREYFMLDICKIGEMLGANCIELLKNYSTNDMNVKNFNEKISSGICELAVKLGEANDTLEFKQCITNFYKAYGVGRFGLNEAFRINEVNGQAEIIPISNITQVNLDDLVGYELAKKALVENTDAFLMGKKSNNCLLYGDAGTGKSTCIKAILNENYCKGLRIIEVYKHQFKLLNDVISQIKNRNYKFIIYMDDLSFEEFEIEYKYLKAVIEGGLEKKPSNVLFYATSNRRHLVREELGDRQGIKADMHTTETMAEKLSLASRFGESIYFNPTSKKEYDNIVVTLARKEGIDMDDDKLILEAYRWEVSHGGKSGRTARQFIDHLLGLNNQ